MAQYDPDMPMACAGKSLLDYEREAKAHSEEQPTLLEALYDNQTTVKQDLDSIQILIDKLRIKIKGIEMPTAARGEAVAPVLPQAATDKSLTAAVNREAKLIDKSQRIHKELTDLLRQL